MKFALNDKVKEFSWFPGDKFLNLIFSRNWVLVFFVHLEKNHLW